MPTKMELQALLTKISLGVMLLGVCLLIFYAVGYFLRGKAARRPQAKPAAGDSDPANPPPPSTHSEHRHHHHRRHHSRREGHRNPTLKDAGGLPPLRPEGTPPPA